MTRAAKSLAAALLLAVVALPADLAAQGAVEPRRALASLEVEGLPAEAWADSFEAALLGAKPIGSVTRASGAGSAAEEAARLGLDLAVRARAALAEGPKVRVVRLSWSIYAPGGLEPLCEGSAEVEEPDERYIADAWAAVAAEAAAVAATLGAAGTATLVLTGPPGAHVTGLGRGKRELPAGGRLELTLPAPATYSWRAVAPGFASKGYLPLRGALVLGHEGDSLELDFERPRPWRIEAALLVATYPDCWVSRSFLGDRLFARVGLWQYLGGVNLNDESAGGELAAFQSYPLIQPGLGLGAYLGRQDRTVRPYLGVLATTRLVVAAGAGLFVDPAAPFSLGPIFGLEWRAVDRWGFFVELLGSVYLFGDGSLMAASRSSGESNELYGDTWYVDFPLMRVGARFTL